MLKWHIVYGIFDYIANVLDSEDFDLETKSVLQNITRNLPAGIDTYKKNIVVVLQSFEKVKPSLIKYLQWTFSKYKCKELISNVINEFYMFISILFSSGIKTKAIAARLKNKKIFPINISSLNFDEIAKLDLFIEQLENEGIIKPLDDAINEILEDY